MTDAPPTPSPSPELQIEQFGAIEPASGGHVIAISFQTTSGENVKLHVPHEALPNLFYLLQSAGADAARQRLAGPTASDRRLLLDPIYARSCAIGVARNHLAIRFVTTLGVPLTVAVPHGMVTDLASELLRKAAALPGPFS